MFYSNFCIVPWKGQAAFTSLDLKPWKSEKDGKEMVAGMFKEVNIKMVDGDEKKTRFALVTIDGSGHMVCYIMVCERLGRILMFDRFRKINQRWLWTC